MSTEDIKNKKLLIIGAGFLQTFVIKKAKELGYYTLTVDGNPHAEGFEFADEYLAENPSDAVIWRNRKRYWMRYWRDRRIVAAKVYARLNNEVAQRWKGKIPMGAYSSGGTPRQILLVIEFEEGVTAFEFSHNGALRFSRRLLTPTRRISWDFYDVRGLTYEVPKINHTTGWESRADDQIERLTGRPSPRH